MSLSERINALDEPSARQAMENCCAAPEWIAQMLDRRPFGNDVQVLTAAREIWNSLDRNQWLTAFAAHPQIGDLASLQKKYSGTAGLAAGEQSAAAGADEATLRELASYNRQYLDKFGYIFIVFATGKSAAEMLALVKARMNNDPAPELHIAAAEQLKITLLRLEKLAA